MSGRLQMTGDQVGCGDAAFGKSYVPHEGYVPALQAGSKKLRQAAANRAEQRATRPRTGPLHGRGTVSSSRRENNALTLIRNIPTEASGRKNVAFASSFPAEHRQRVLDQLPKKVRRPVTIQNGSKGATEIGQDVQGYTLGRAGTKRPANVVLHGHSANPVIRHEYEHSQPRRSYHRLAALQESRAGGGAREEARADARMIQARGAKEPIASDYEAQAIMHREAGLGNRAVNPGFVGDPDRAAEYTRMRNKLGVPLRGLEHLPQSRIMDKIREEAKMRDGRRARWRKDVGKAATNVVAPQVPKPKKLASPAKPPTPPSPAVSPPSPPKPPAPTARVKPVAGPQPVARPRPATPRTAPKPPVAKSYIPGAGTTPRARSRRGRCAAWPTGVARRGWRRCGRRTASTPSSTTTSPSR